MFPIRTIGLTALLAFASLAPVRGDEAVKDPTPEGAGPVSFLKDVAPILVQNCIACHNPKKSESKYNMTTFALLAKGGQQGEGITLEPGDPDASRFVELIRPDGEPRMPYKQDPLPAGEGRDHRALGQGGGQVRRRRRRPRTGRPSSARTPRS